MKKPSRIGWKPLSVRAKSLALIVKGKLQGKSLRKPEKPFFFNYIDVIRLSFFMNCLRFSDIYADGNGKHRIDWLMQAIFFVRSVLEIRIGATEHRTAEANVIESWLLNTHFLCQRWKKFLHNTVGGQMGREMMAGASARKPPKPPKHLTTEYGQQIHGEDNGSEFQLYLNFAAKNINKIQSVTTEVRENSTQYKLLTTYMRGIKFKKSNRNSKSGAFLRC